MSGALEKTQTYNLSLEASAHDLLAAVTSTRRAPVVLTPQDDRGRKRTTGAGVDDRGQELRSERSLRPSRAQTH